MRIIPAVSADPLPDPSPLSKGEELFADWLAEQRGSDPRPFEKLCAAHPAHVAELRVLWRDWMRLQSILRRAGLSPDRLPLADELRRHFGAEVDPGVSLSGEAPGSDSGPSSELLKRLRAHAPKSTRYKLLGEIGRGGMGAVLRIWDEDLRRTLAMKVVLGKDDAARKGATPPVDSRVLGRFLEEAQVTGQLDHPGIVPVHELGLDADGRVYFTMRLVKGENLKRVFEHVKSGHEGWNETRALGVLLKVCEAMSYAHDKGVVHRDLKPANVMVGKFFEVYVMDWGLARVLGQKDRHDVRVRPEPVSSASVRTERRDERSDTPDSPLMTMDGDVVGTPAYMAPEQARGDLDAMGPHSDVYAVGAMIYHLLAKQAPFVPPDARLNNYAVWQRVQEGPPRPLIELAPRAPAELIAICERAMERTPARRYKDMLALAADLRAYLERRVVTAYETGTWAETKKWVQRNKALTASLAAAALMLVAGTIATSLQWRRADAKATEAETARKDLEATNRRLLLAEREARVRALAKELELFELRDDDVYTYARQEERPASEWWLEGARRLVHGVPDDPQDPTMWRPGLRDVEERLAAVRARAEEWTADERARDRDTHPRAGELPRLEAMCTWQARMLKELPWPTADAAETELARDGLPTEAEALNSAAWARVDPDSREVGAEVEGLVLARRAVSAASWTHRPACRDTLAWALFFTGRLDEALEESRTVLSELSRLPPFLLPTDSPGTWPRLHLSLRVSCKRLEQQVALWREPKRADRVLELEFNRRDLAELKVLLDERRTWRFADTRDDAWHELLVAVADGLRLLAKKIECAHRSLHGPEVEAEWAKAIQGITASDRYRGANWPGGRLTPQIGLVPIGPDPDSGLWEFAHIATGRAAQRDANARICRENGLGLVLVLLPGGRVPEANSGDQRQIASLTTVDLDPFFLSKYEMTREQWHRIEGWERSGGASGTFMLPARDLSWDDCNIALPRAGWLRLPSEAQWEYACRAGTRTKWWTGDDATTLREAANVRFDDKVRLEMRATGELRANHFGLQDMHGNAWEWCSDAFRDGVRRPGDGLNEAPGGEIRVCRGGGHIGEAEDARSSYRIGYEPGNRPGAVGLRPARGITP